MLKFQKTLPLAILIVSALAAPATSAAAAPSLTGKWVTAPSGDGGAIILCNFTQKDNALSGDCSVTSNAGQGPFGPVSGSVNGKNVSWIWPRGERSVVYAGQWDL